MQIDPHSASANSPSSTPVKDLCGQEIHSKIFFEKVRNLPFFLLSLRGIPLKAVLLLPYLSPSQAPGPSSSEHKSFRPLGFVGPLCGGGVQRVGAQKIGFTLNTRQNRIYNLRSQSLIWELLFTEVLGVPSFCL